MKRFAKRLLAYALLCGLYAVLGLAISYSIYSDMKLSTMDQIQSLNNITENETKGFTEAVYLSRNSSVNVMSMSSDGVIGSSSGTYVLINGKYYILTVSHGIREDCQSIRIIVGSEFYECKELTVLNRQQDYAIIEIEQIFDRIPIKIPKHTPKNSRWDESLAIQNRIVYSGFPNSSGLLTLDGKIVGFNDNEDMFIHSYAWPGASGSGVFNEDGKLIGYIMAISLGFTEYGISVLEDIVIVVPLFKIDWDELEQ